MYIAKHLSSVWAVMVPIMPVDHVAAVRCIKSWATGTVTVHITHQDEENNVEWPVCWKSPVVSMWFSVVVAHPPQHLTCCMLWNAFSVHRGWKERLSELPQEAVTWNHSPRRTVYYVLSAHLHDLTHYSAAAWVLVTCYTLTMLHGPPGIHGLHFQNHWCS